ncbi:hypothetical protein JXM67_09745 [candidate division WOR-3 bacterium]|nr:hypothetical protein [candidate division WOR-3 bacterium]
MPLLNILWCLLGFGKAEAQADALLSRFITTTEVCMSDYASAIDDLGYLWFVWNDGDNNYALRFNRNGKVALEKTSLPEAGYVGPIVLTDRWCNAYFTLGGWGGSSCILGRISPTGEIEVFSSWLPNLGSVAAYMEIIPGDTFWIVGDGIRTKDCEISKGLITPEGITPVSKEIHPETIVLRNLMYRDEYTVALIDFENRIGRTYFPVRDKLYQHTYSLDDYEHEEREYRLRDYIWRSYTDIWINRSICAPHKDGGYSLCIKDPFDTTTTHIVRLNENRELVDPSTLSGGGVYSARSFDRLPRNTKAYAALEVKILGKEINGQYYMHAPDSACVIFWGCDDEGNLYAYQKVKRYGEEQ